MSSELTTHNGGGPLLALAYLILPVALFWALYIGGPLGAALALAPPIWAAWLWHTGRLGGGISMHDWIIGLAWSLPVLVVMGFPSGPWVWDWFKHWALIGTLADRPWPVRLELQGDRWVLRFYLAAYLVPALFIQAGMEMRMATALWFGFGTALLLAFVSSRVRLRHGAAWACLAPGLFLLLAGADAVVEYSMRALVDPRALSATAPLGLHTEWWALDHLGALLQYTGMLAALTWVPHQAIATFIVAAVLVGAPLRGAPWAAALGMAALALWSPLGLLGLLPLLVWRLAMSRQEWAATGQARWQAAAGALTLVPLVWCTARFLASDMPATGFSVPDLATLASCFSAGAFFVVVELAPCALLLGNRLWRDPQLRLCGMTLLLIPLLGGGDPPDFVMRTSMGPLAILMLEAVRTASVRWGEGRRGASAVLLGLLLSLPTSLNEVLYHLSGGSAHQGLPSGDPMRHPSRLSFSHDSKVSVPAFFDECGWRYLPQYFARRPVFIAQEK